MYKREWLSKMKRWAKRRAEVLAWLFLAAMLCITVAGYARAGRHNLNSDISSEMVLAELLNREGSLLSEGWYYSTELRVVSSVPVYQLGLRLFPGDWHMARTFSIAVLLTLLSASIIYMGRGAGLRASPMFAAGALLLPIGSVQAFLLTYGGFYTTYIALAFAIIGMVLRLPLRRGRIRRLVLIAVLSFWGGLNGVRMPMLCGAPLLLACAWGLWDALREAERPAQALHTPQAMMALGAGVSGAAMVAAFLINWLYLSQRYTFRQYGGAAMGAVDADAFLAQLRHFVGYFGYEDGVRLLSARGIGNLLTLALLAAFVWALVKAMRSRARRDAQARLLGDFSACALAVGLTLNAVLGEYENAYSTAYYLPGVFALVMTLFAQTERLDCRMPWLRTLCSLAVAGIFVWQGSEYVLCDLRTIESEHECAAEWLTENGYTQGYATFWNGNVLTECSDGQLELIVYDNWYSYEPYPWLQEKVHLTELPQGRVFVYVDDSELADEPPCAKEEHLVWRGEGAGIYAYDSAEEIEMLQHRLSD